MAWEVEFTNEFEKWWMKLSEREQIAVATRVEELRRRGPGLRRPLVDRIESSRHRGAMRELRCPTSIRVLFAFGPSSTAILLIGGNKGDENQDEPDWNGWYLVYVPIADDLYDEYLRELKREVDPRR